MPSSAGSTRVSRLAKPGTIYGPQPGKSIRSPREEETTVASWREPMKLPSAGKSKFAIMNRNAPVAQWIEQETSKLLAVGSIPTRGTISKL